MIYLLTASGARIDLLAPDPADITLPDVSEALSRISRFTGHAGGYTVAQHSVLVAEHLRNLGHPEGVQRQGLLHDAHEAYTGDVASPIKRSLRALTREGSTSVWDLFEENHARALRARFRIPGKLAPAVHCADLALLMAEKRDLLPPDADPPSGGWPDVEPSPLRVYPVPPHLARERFLEECGRLGVV